MMADFDSFFTAVHGMLPFPWQSMLAEQLARTGQWPAIIDLPTASGKTAILDIAVWHLAQQAYLPPNERTAPRRIWFVVDRRIVVDEAHQRATHIANWLQDHPNDEISSALRRISGLGGLDYPQEMTPTPLAVGRLRGGVLHDRGWATFPSQPAILTSTVDQFGSRLLFRGYGLSSSAWPIHAALAGNDALLVLDEAHLAEPLTQTLEAFANYRSVRWAEDPIALPWQMTRLSATPPPPQEPRSSPAPDAPASPPFNGGNRFPSEGDRAAALNHPLLKQRGVASKRATLVRVDLPKAARKRPADACAEEATRQARQFVAAGRRRIAVMLNRVDAAVAVHAALEAVDDLDAILLTGRMRPLDREQVLRKWAPLLHSSSKETSDKPIVLVTTQCLEVGADFSFDALVTECASLDALRQRFGRLDRLGTLGQTEAAVLAWHGDLTAETPDPIYGQALRHTWQWLESLAQDNVVDFGIAALQPAVDALSASTMANLLPPRSQAPILLPAYLDAWCQTSSPPHVEADPALFLHGPQAAQAEVQVVFRRDLPADDDAHWEKIIQLMPPVAGERLTVALHRLKKWLASEPLVADCDVEGLPIDEPVSVTGKPPERWVIYRKRDLPKISCDSGEIRPGDIVILPAGERIPPALGHGEQTEELLGRTTRHVDLLEQAVLASGRPPLLRIDPSTLAFWARSTPDAEAQEQLTTWLKRDDETATDPDRWSEVRPFLEQLLPPSLDGLRPYLTTEAAEAEPPRISRHPTLDGLLLQWQRVPKSTQQSHTRPTEQESDLFTGEDDSPSLIGQPISLATHTQQVTNLAHRLASACVPAFTEVMTQAAQWHDAGKIEPRFQALLHNQIWASAALPPLAKSGRISSPLDQKLRQELGIQGFRHEMYSMQRAATELAAVDDLLLHLIASHHGHARPFAPCFPDALWTSPPPHHPGSGVAERFWSLTRRHGWWGLAYLEALLRLADQHASRFPHAPQSEAPNHA